MLGRDVQEKTSLLAMLIEGCPDVGKRCPREDLVAGDVEGRQP